MAIGDNFTDDQFILLYSAIDKLMRSEVDGGFPDLTPEETHAVKFLEQAVDGDNNEEKSDTQAQEGFELQMEEEVRRSVWKDNPLWRLLRRLWRK